MATTFTHEQCIAILQPAFSSILPAIGLNQHFPYLMLFGHQHHYGPGIPLLYDNQSYLHLVALFMHLTETSIT